MENLNIIENSLVVLLFVALAYIAIYINYKYKQSLIINNNYEKEINLLISENNKLSKLIIKEEEENHRQSKSINDLYSFLNLFINQNTSLIVYSFSNFHKNYNFHNKRYYAKVNNKIVNNKAEAIPFLQIKGQSNTVFDLYKFIEITNRTRPQSYIDTLNIISSCYITKEEVIKNLGNKILKNYKG